MTIAELLRCNRSYRRFRQEAIGEGTLRELVELTRLCPSAANRQPLKYMLSWTAERNAQIFPQLRWAAALAPWPGPAEGERPTAYIVVVGDTRVWRKWDWDAGIVGQCMLLGATERGLGGCMIASIERPALQAVLGLPEHLEILLVVALGKPGETVVLEDGSPDQRPYWRDEQGVHHVPKRPLEELIL